MLETKRQAFLGFCPRTTGVFSVSQTYVDVFPRHRWMWLCVCVVCVCVNVDLSIPTLES